MSDGEQPCADDENEKDHKPAPSSPTESQEDPNVLDVTAETAPEEELIHQNGPTLEQEGVALL